MARLQMCPLPYTGENAHVTVFVKPSVTYVIDEDTFETSTKQ